MTVNGKRDDFTVADLVAAGEVGGLPRGRARRTLAEVGEVVSGWPAIAEQVGVAEAVAERIARSHRLRLPRA
jgi:serine/threonine-protein kinase HipA